MEKEKKKAIIIIGCTIVLFYCVLQNLSAIGNSVTGILSIFVPFILGGAIAFILNVPMKQIEKHLFQGKKMEKYKKFRRPAAYLLTLVLVIVVITGVVMVVVPEIGKTITDLINRLPKSVEEMQNIVNSLMTTYPELQDVLSSFEFNPDQIISNVSGFLSTWSQGLISSGVGIISGVVSGIGNFFIAFVFSIYLLFQKENLARQGKKILYALFNKEHTERTLSILTLTNKTFASFISGQCLEAVILGSMFVVTMSIFRLPYAWLMGVIIAVTALVPMVGAFLGCVIGIFLILMVSPMQALIFAIMFLVLQQVEGNLIYPHVVGKSVGLPGMWVLMAVVVGGNLFGVVGMLVFIPLFSVFYVLFREFVNHRLTQKKIVVK